MSDAADGDLLLGHHLEQRRLHLCGSAVDLVGQQEVDEHRAELDVERFAAAPVDAGAGDVGGQQVGGELDAGEGAADHVGESFGGKCLRESGHRLEQTVTSTQHADQQAFEQPCLADHHLAELEEDRLERLGGLSIVGWGRWDGRGGRRRVGLVAVGHCPMTVAVPGRSMGAAGHLSPTSRTLNPWSNVPTPRPKRLLRPDVCR